jgi:nickel superoxide dismutase
MIKFIMIIILINNKGNLMKKFNLVLTFSLLTNVLVAHCQIPCGIYDDALRVLQIKENFQTIKKAMNKIVFLSSELTPQSSQQIVRWVNTKEEHADKTQKLLSEYFLAQRISEKNDEYFKQLSSIHKLIVNSMKCKQTVNLDYIKQGLHSLDNFNKLYFDAHGIEHLNVLESSN